jgi:coenzyme F420 hydrogenase subunit delta
LNESVLILGCGNTLFGDDGFGPAVVERLLKDHDLPAGVLAMDVGTSVREVLFDLLLSQTKPRRIIVLDAVEHEGRQPGEIFEIDVDQISPEKTADFSLHQFPTVNMLKELQDHFPIEVTILVAQVQDLPEEVRPGLSPAMEKAVTQACLRLKKMVGSE